MNLTLLVLWRVGEISMFCLLRQRFPKPIRHFCSHSSNVFFLGFELRALECQAGLRRIHQAQNNEQAKWVSLKSCPHSPLRREVAVLSDQKPWKVFAGAKVTEGTGHVGKLCK